MKDDLNHKRIIIAKTTHIGDVIISLPMAGILKRVYPHCHIIFLASGAACQLAKMSVHVDEVVDWQAINRQGKQQAVTELKKLNVDVFLHVNPFQYLGQVVKEAGIPIRVGSVFRWYHWLTCNRLAFISRSAKYNKRQLDLQYLKPLGVNPQVTYDELCSLYQFNFVPLTHEQQQWLATPKFKVIVHPSLITAQHYQWPLSYYAELIKRLSADKFQVFISGTESDRIALQPLLNECPHAIDIIGKLRLDEFLTFMHHCQALIAGSTGPLHMAAAVGIHALGIYRPDKTYIKRWEPVGVTAEVICDTKPCKSCPNDNPCHCIKMITPDIIFERITKMFAYFEI